MYLERSTRYSSVQHETFPTLARLVTWTESLKKRGTVRLVLFDSAGRLHTSEEIATLVDQAGTGGCQHLIFAIGPADGWIPEIRAVAHGTISFGRITLPHELALVVAAEQIYRALTIVAGHPYHSGH